MRNLIRLLRELLEELRAFNGRAPQFVKIGVVIVNLHNMIGVDPEPDEDKIQDQSRRDFEDRYFKDYREGPPYGYKVIQVYFTDGNNRVLQLHHDDADEFLRIMDGCSISNTR